MYHNMRWTVKKIGQRIGLVESLVHRRKQPLAAFRFQEIPNPKPEGPLNDQLPVGVDVDDSDWQEIPAYTHWGKRYTDFVMRTEFSVPEDWTAEGPVALYLPLGEPGDFSHPEALAYADGIPFAACDRHHQEIVLPPEFSDGTEHLLALRGWTGLVRGFPLEDDPGLYMKPCAVVLIDQPTRDFVATARVAHGIAQYLDEDAPERGMLLNALDDAFKLLDLREPIGDAFYVSVIEAHAALKRGIEKSGAPMDVSIVASGHAHIDVAWLWTLGQTRLKAGRTFHTVMRLMEQFPEYHFTQSQPQLYDYVRNDYPELFEQIGKRIAEGRWETIGGMWVEADCNLSGPESLARQFLLGRSFFHKYYGNVDSPVLWLPDVFGYAWNLPQLIKEAGLEYFFTIKIGWSQYNRLPYDSFWWQGLDGTKVLTHFSTTPDFGAYASTYNAMADPRQALGTWTNFQQKEQEHELLMAFGFGDGGGGPTREMLENIREMGSFPGAPQMRQTSVKEFFQNLERDSGDVLPTWNGELYLELHRGTYTTQSRNKRANRKSEFLLHDAEFTATLASLLAPDYEYPADALHRAWEIVCLNQFHDIIPGSSINQVYVESQQQYEEVRALGEEVRDRALQAVGSRMDADVIVANPTAFAQQNLCFLPGEWPEKSGLKTAAGYDVSVQQGAGGLWIDCGEMPPFSVTPLKTGTKSNATKSGLSASDTHLENDFLRVELNADGDIFRLFDKTASREILPEGALANQFQAFEDRPLNWDAWDVDIFYDDKMWTAEPAQSVEVIEQGPLHATIEIRRRVLNSDYVQRISLAHNSPRLDFETTIEWRERHVMLKVAFPVDVLTPTATYEIQWGNVQRPTHRNTSWDWARFETAAQKWVDLSEGDYGVSLMNDCKYGHDIHNNVMRISLLRSSTTPDPEADQGKHTFAYSILPHSGPWDERTIAAAYALNDPAIAVRCERTETEATVDPVTLFSVDSPNVVVETVKRAEDGDGVIVRLYEAQRRRNQVKLSAAFPLAGAWRTNIMEEKQADLSVQGNSVTFSVRPYEIVTLRLVPA